MGIFDSIKDFFLPDDWNPKKRKFIDFGEYKEPKIKEKKITASAPYESKADGKYRDSVIEYNKKRKVICDDGVERYWWYNRRNIIVDPGQSYGAFGLDFTFFKFNDLRFMHKITEIRDGYDDEEGDVKIKKVKKITPNKEVSNMQIASLLRKNKMLDANFTLEIPIIKWFKNKGKTMNLKEIIKYNQTLKDDCIINFNSPLYRRELHLAFINGYAIFEHNHRFIPFSGLIDKSQYIEGVLKNK